MMSNRAASKATGEKAREPREALLVCFLPQIAERGTQDFSTRLIKHTELGKRVLRESWHKSFGHNKNVPQTYVSHDDDQDWVEFEKSDR